MTKKKFIDSIVNRLGCEGIKISKKDCEACINIAILTIRTEVLEEDEFSYPGFGKFKKVTRAARKGVNPKTHEAIEISERDAVTFKAAPGFLDV